MLIKDIINLGCIVSDKKYLIMKKVIYTYMTSVLISLYYYFSTRKLNISKK